MERGKKSGVHNAACVRGPISCFVNDEGGYTSLTVAVSLLVSLTLVFSLAAAQWVMAREADVQEVADASAMAGANCVAAFSTIVQTIDACVLSMGLAGALVCGAGLVIAAIPGLQEASPKVLSAGKDVLDARKRFAESSAQGLQRLEQALPALIMANSASCASANSTDTLSYVGFAMPFPQESKSDYSFLKDELSADDMAEKAKKLQEAAEKKEQAQKRAQVARERGWKADTIDEPMCMRSRASSLAGLEGAQNPHYATAETWEFEFARQRACNYYATRLAQADSDNSNPDAMQRAECRRVFYGYAYEEINAGVCIDTADHVEMRLPELAHNTEMIRGTHLYTDVAWPLTEEEDKGLVLHASLACPGATGGYAGLAAISHIDGRGVLRCDVCRMDARALGNVANASTNIDNGFEHYWQKLVEASRDYQRAKEEEIAAERELQEAADKGKSAFQEAIDQLSVERPKLQPAGSWGCVSIVYRPEGSTVPTELTRSFLQEAKLPSGVAMSAATLAPDGTSEGGGVLAHLFDGLKAQGGSLTVDLVGDICELWGSLLEGYGAGYESISNVADKFLDGIGGVFGEKVASWLRERIAEIVKKTGFEPADMRLRKPVLINTQLVFDKAGMSSVAKGRELLETLPSSPEELVALLWGKLREQLGDGSFTVAELPIPGLDGVSIPLTINLSGGV